MQYRLKATEKFDKWFSGLRDGPTRNRILSRLARVENGNFGSYRNLKGELYELKFNFGSGFRVYYTFRGDCIVLLLAGGDKSSQKFDIPLARGLLDDLEYL